MNTHESASRIAEILKGYFGSPSYNAAVIGTGRIDVAIKIAADAIAAELDKELKPLVEALDRIEHETCGQCNYMRSIATPCKCGQFSVKGTNDQLRAQLAEARELLNAARAGQPLGPIIGAQTMLNQDNEIRQLKAQLAIEQEKVRKLWTGIRQIVNLLPHFGISLPSIIQTILSEMEAQVTPRELEGLCK